MEIKTIGEWMAYRQALIDASDYAKILAEKFEQEARLSNNDFDNLKLTSRAVGAVEVGKLLLEKEKEYKQKGEEGKIFTHISQSSVAMKPH